MTQFSNAGLELNMKDVNFRRKKVLLLLKNYLKKYLINFHNQKYQ